MENREDISTDIYSFSLQECSFPFVLTYHT